MKTKITKTTPSQSATAVVSIDDFSDEILTHILSFLPFKDAFRTTVLSKRWFPLFYSLSVLHFDDAGVKTTDDWSLFRLFMDSVMFSPHSQNITLKSFHLKCCSLCWDSKYDRFILNDWLQQAKRRRVEELDLLILFGTIPLIPTIFVCKTLVVLKLMSISVLTMSYCSVDLPLLKTLDLRFVRFECMEDFMKLISGCPILENLRTSFVKTTAHFRMVRHIDSMNELMEAVEGGYSKPRLSNLIKADIHVFDVPLRGISGVQFLSLTGLGQSFPNEEINTYYKGFPVFENLIELRLSWFSSCILDWNEVVTMLQNCPKLQTLSISKCRNSTPTEDWNYPGHVPECVSSHLTTCKIIDYEPLEADFQFATYILKNARVLQVMEIRCPFTPKAMTSPKFIESLVSCPRISSACKLSLE